MKSSLPGHFCVIPFVHFSCKPDGSPRICCFSQDAYVRDENGRKTNLGKDSIPEIWHSQWMNGFRQRMFEGTPLPECQFCYDEEASGKKSKRQSENEKYLASVGSTIDFAQQNQGAINSHPIYYDLRLGNLCNLKCRSCNPHSSSSWAKEVEENLSSFMSFPEYAAKAADVRQSGNWYQLTTFWDQFDTIAGDIQEIYFTGGEPMLIKEHFAMLRFLISKGLSSGIYLRYNTNLTKLPEECAELFPHFKHVHLSCSIDGLKEKNNWLRSPSKWPVLMKNLEKAMGLSDNVEIEINCTVSVFNISLFPEMIQFFKDFEMPYGKKIKLYPDLLHDPPFMRMELLPSRLKQQADQRLALLMESEEFTSYEKTRFQALRQILGKTNARQAELLAQLKEHILTLDGLRRENFAETFPELAELVAP